MASAPRPLKANADIHPSLLSPKAVQDDLDAVVVALSTVADVVGDLGGTDLARRADAIELLERLLPDAGLSPGRYQAVLRNHPGEVQFALSAVHEAVGMRARERGADATNRTRPPAGARQAR